MLSFASISKALARVTKHRATTQSTAAPAAVASLSTSFFRATETVDSTHFSLAGTEVSARLARINEMVANIEKCRRQQRELLSVIDRPYLSQQEFDRLNARFSQHYLHFDDLIRESEPDAAWLAQANAQIIGELIVKMLARSLTVNDPSMTVPTVVKALNDREFYDESLSSLQHCALNAAVTELIGIDVTTLHAFLRSFAISVTDTSNEWNDSKSDILGNRPLSLTIELVQRERVQYPWVTLVPSIIRRLTYSLYLAACERFPVSEVNAFSLYDAIDDSSAGANERSVPPLRSSPQSRITIHKSSACELSPLASLMIDSHDSAMIDQLKLSELARLVFTERNDDPAATIEKW